MGGDMENDENGEPLIYPGDPQHTGVPNEVMTHEEYKQEIHGTGDEQALVPEREVHNFHIQPGMGECDIMSDYDAEDSGETSNES